MARAMSSLPVPLSPMMHTLASPPATLSIFARTSRSCCDCPMIPEYALVVTTWAGLGGELMAPIRPVTRSSHASMRAVSADAWIVASHRCDLKRGPLPRRPCLGGEAHAGDTMAAYRSILRTAQVKRLHGTKGFGA